MSAAPPDRRPARSSAAGSGTRCRDAPGTRDRRALRPACGRAPIAAASRGGGETGVPSRSTPAGATQRARLPKRRARQSSVTRGAARELLNLILRHELPADLELVRRRLVVDAEDVGARAHV